MEKKNELELIWKCNKYAPELIKYLLKMYMQKSIRKVSGECPSWGTTRLSRRSSFNESANCLWVTATQTALRSTWWTWAQSTKLPTSGFDSLFPDASVVCMYVYMHAILLSRHSTILVPLVKVMNARRGFNAALTSRAFHTMPCELNNLEQPAPWNASWLQSDMIMFYLETTIGWLRIPMDTVLLEETLHPKHLWLTLTGDRSSLIAVLLNFFVYPKMPPKNIILCVGQMKLF